MGVHYIWWEDDWLSLSGGGSGVPSTIHTVNATPGNAQVTLTWVAPYEGGSPITDYIVERAPDVTGTPGAWTTLSDGVGVGVTYIDSAVVNDTTYWYRVSAQNVIGVGPVSTAVSATPDEPPVLLYDSFVSAATEGPRGWWDTGAGTNVQEWTPPYANGFDFKVLSNALIHGARVWRPNIKDLASDGAPIVCLSLSGGYRPIIVSEPMTPGPPAVAQWETYLFDEPYAVLADAEMCIWINSLSGTVQVPLARQADYFSAVTPSVYGLMETMDPCARYASPHNLDEDLTPFSTIAGVWYWIDPLVTAE